MKHLPPTFAVLSLATAVALTCAGCGCGNPSSAGGSSAGGGSVAITGAGSTFVNPAMSTWDYNYNKANPGVTINYQSVGSGAGISQYEAGTVDFGATDAPLEDKDLQKFEGENLPTIQFPIVSGATVIAYNIPGVQSGLKLTPDVIADIYLGKIKAWNDPRIVSLNPGTNLPNTPISVAYRSDASGTTFIFTDYLSSVSPAWKSGPGKGKTVSWPVGVGGKGNEGVAGLVKQTPGGIGYVEFAYAVKGNLTYAAVKNKAGNFVTASTDSTAAAVAAAADALKKDIRSSIVNQGGKDSYPIAGMTYVLLSKTPKDAKKSEALGAFLKWALADGQAQAKDLQYAPLPPAVIDLDNQALSQVKAK